MKSIKNHLEDLDLFDFKQASTCKVTLGFKRLKLKPTREFKCVAKVTKTILPLITLIIDAYVVSPAKHCKLTLIMRNSIIFVSILLVKSLIRKGYEESWGIREVSTVIRHPGDGGKATKNF